MFDEQRCDRNSHLKETTLANNTDTPSCTNKTISITIVLWTPTTIGTSVCDKHACHRKCDSLLARIDAITEMVGHVNSEVQD